MPRRRTGFKDIGFEEKNVIRIGTFLLGKEFHLCPLIGRILQKMLLFFFFFFHHRDSTNFFYIECCFFFLSFFWKRNFPRVGYANEIHEFIALEIIYIEWKKIEETWTVVFDLQLHNLSFSPNTHRPNRF